MTHEQAPKPHIEQIEIDSPLLSDEERLYLESQANRSFIVVRGAGTEDRRTEDGWYLTGRIESFDDASKPWVTLSNGEGEKRVRVDALMHYNPIGESSSQTNETNVGQESTAVQLGEEAVSEVVEKPSTDIQESEVALSAEVAPNQVEEDSEAPVEAAETASESIDTEKEIQELKTKLAELVRLRDADGELIALVAMRVDALRDEAERLQSVLHRADERMPLQANPSIRNQIEVFVSETRKVYAELQKTESNPAVYTTVLDASERLRALGTTASAEQKAVYRMLQDQLDGISREQVVLGHRLSIDAASHNLIATSAQFLGAVNNLESTITQPNTTVVDADAALQYIVRDVRAFVEGLQRQHQRMRTSSEQLYSYSQSL